MTTIGDYVSHYEELLNKAGISDARLEVLYMLSEITGKTSTQLSLAMRDVWNFSPEVEDELEKASRRRAKHEPVAYIFERAYFYNEVYACGPGVLIPRPDTELLVEKAFEKVTSQTNRQIRIIDLCTGTGCVGISLTNELTKSGFHCTTYLIDIDDTALDFARKNLSTQLKRNSGMMPEVSVIKADVLDSENIIRLFGHSDSYTIIVSNPPYITDSDMKTLDDDVKLYEPSIALYGGEGDATIFYKALSKIAVNILSGDECILAEHGYDQRESVGKIFSESGLSNVVCYKDYGGNDRVTVGIRTCMDGE